MKENLGSKMFYVTCAAMGILTGFGSWKLMEQENVKQEQYNRNYTKDNTLFLDVENGVFHFLLQPEQELKRNVNLLKEITIENKTKDKIEDRIKELGNIEKKSDLLNTLEKKDKVEVVQCLPEEEKEQEEIIKDVRESEEKLNVSDTKGVGESEEKLFVSGTKGTRESEEKLNVSDTKGTRESEEKLFVSDTKVIRESEEKLNVSDTKDIEESEERLFALDTEEIRGVGEEMEKTVSAGVALVPIPTISLTLSDTLKQVEFQQEDVQKNSDIKEKLSEYDFIESKDLVTAGNTDSTEFNTAPGESGTTLSYPSEILGQTPKINRTDAYVTYFEFALDLVETIQPMIKEKELSEISLFTQFVMRALVYGVDVLGLNINEPISRAEAALTLWLAADILDEPGSDTSSKSAGKYVTDIKNCSKAERKSVAYLYEQGVLSGYQIAGQKFRPQEYLETADGEQWMKKIQQCWK